MSEPVKKGMVVRLDDNGAEIFLEVVHIDKDGWLDLMVVKTEAKEGKFSELGSFHRMRESQDVPR